MSLHLKDGEQKVFTLRKKAYRTQDIGDIDRSQYTPDQQAYIDLSEKYILKCSELTSIYIQTREYDESQKGAQELAEDICLKVSYLFRMFPGKIDGKGPNAVARTFLVAEMTSIVYELFRYFPQLGDNPFREKIEEYRKILNTIPHTQFGLGDRKIITNLKHNGNGYAGALLKHTIKNPDLLTYLYHGYAGYHWEQSRAWTKTTSYTGILDTMDNGAFMHVQSSRDIVPMQVKDILSGNQSEKQEEGIKQLVTIILQQSDPIGYIHEIQTRISQQEKFDSHLWKMHNFLGRVITYIRLKHPLSRILE